MEHIIIHAEVTLMYENDNFKEQSKHICTNMFGWWSHAQASSPSTFQQKWTDWNRVTVAHRLCRLTDGAYKWTSRNGPTEPESWWHTGYIDWLTVYIHRLSTRNGLPDGPYRIMYPEIQSFTVQSIVILSLAAKSGPLDRLIRSVLLS